jgi:hypothetical protein
LVPTPLGGTSSPTLTSTSTGTILAKATVDAKILEKPSCSLPDYFPACQSSWDDWFHYKYVNLSIYSSPDPVSCTQFLSAGSQALSCSTPPAMTSWMSLLSLAGRPKPSCTQAKMTGSACSTMVDGLLRATQDRGRATDGVVMQAMNVSSYVTKLGTADHATTILTTSWFWEPSHEFAPGCTLGCQSCQINGGTVQLLYWPPQSSLEVNGSATTGTAGASTLVTLGTTLTSPTLYVSFDSLYARDSCSAFGKTHSDQIIAITSTASLSLLYGWNSFNGLLSSASFNLTDLRITWCPEFTRDVTDTLLPGTQVMCPMTYTRVSHAAPHLWQHSANGMPMGEAGCLRPLIGPVLELLNMVSSSVLIVWLNRRFSGIASFQMRDVSRWVARQSWSIHSDVTWQGFGCLLTGQPLIVSQPQSCPSRTKCAMRILIGGTALAASMVSTILP